MTPLSITHKNTIIASYNSQLNILIDFLLICKGMSRNEAIKYAQSLRPEGKAFQADDEYIVQEALLKEFQILASNNTY